MTYGANNGSWAAFMALEGIHDNGFRDFAKSMIRRMYADLGAKGDDTEFHLNYTGADNFVGVTAAAPVQLLDQSWSNTFTSPQTTVNQVNMISLNGTLKASPTLTFSGVSYYRWFNQKHVDGNISEAEDCTTDPTVLCEDGDDTQQLFGIGPRRQPRRLDTFRYRLPARLARPHLADRQQLWPFGSGRRQVAAVRARNQFLLGASFDYGHVAYARAASSVCSDRNFVVNGLDHPAHPAPTMSARATSRRKHDYVGVYFSDTIDLTASSRWTVGGRYNFARLTIGDNTGFDPEVNSDTSTSASTR